MIHRFTMRHPRCRQAFWSRAVLVLLFVFVQRAHSFMTCHHHHGGVSAKAETHNYLTCTIQQQSKGHHYSRLQVMGGDDSPIAEDAKLDEPMELSCTRRQFFLALAGGAALTAASLAVDEAKAIDNNSIRGPSLSSSSNEAVQTSSIVETSEATATATASASVDLSKILEKSFQKALGGGKAGASAAVVQVCSLMWLRTAMNYQYRYGGDLTSALRKLISEGGVPRLYQGLPFAIVQGPLTRFGDTAANVGALALLDSIPETAGLPLPVRSLLGSVSAGLWRIILMPVDASKTVMQVEGAEGLNRLWKKVQDVGPTPLYQGAVASAAATAVGHYPWFLTYNFLNDVLPAFSKEEVLLSLVRSAFLGLSASCVSDCTSNSLRVLKTTKQTAGLGRDLLTSSGMTGKDYKGAVAKKEISYAEALKIVLEEDGIIGLLGRGLKTRLLTNAIQGSAFSVLWKYFQTIGGSQP